MSWWKELIKRNEKARLATDVDGVRESSTSEVETATRPTLMVPAVLVFFVAFTGAALYGFRAAKKAELREAIELIRASSHSPKAVDSFAPTAYLSSALSKSQTSPRQGTQTSGLDWGSSGTSAPSVLFKFGSSISGKAVASPHARFSVPFPKIHGDGKPVFDEPPALTAIKAFGVATALMGVISVASVEFGRRIWKIEDMYDLTDRLHAADPKSFFMEESIWSFFRSRLKRLFPLNDEYHRNSLESTEFVDGPIHGSVPRKLSKLPLFQSSPPSGARRFSPSLSMDIPEVAFQRIKRAETMREKLQILEAQLQAERAEEELFRREFKPRCSRFE